MTPQLRRSRSARSARSSPGTVTLVNAAKGLSLNGDRRGSHAPSGNSDDEELSNLMEADGDVVAGKKAMTKVSGLPGKSNEGSNTKSNNPDMDASQPEAEVGEMKPRGRPKPRRKQKTQEKTAVEPHPHVSRKRVEGKQVQWQVGESGEGEPHNPEEAPKEPIGKGRTTKARGNGRDTGEGSSTNQLPGEEGAGDLGTRSNVKGSPKKMSAEDRDLLAVSSRLRPESEKRQKKPRVPMY